MGTMWLEWGKCRASHWRKEYSLPFAVTPNNCWAISATFWSISQMWITLHLRMIHYTLFPSTVVGMHPENDQSRRFREEFRSIFVSIFRFLEKKIKSAADWIEFISVQSVWWIDTLSQLNLRTLTVALFRNNLEWDQFDDCVTHTRVYLIYKTGYGIRCVVRAPHIPSNLCILFCQTEID